ncbi:serpin-ZX [Lactuca sativa]|uniref:serpin-ZX n=1 Tax=Lactuca sativa TaxID=4236 RepID=UPI000CB20A17|nr:serpin-ZX [Lactuca sativa]
MEIQQSITNQTQVSIKLASHLLSKISVNSNTVFSPLSIHVLLSLVAAGSNGETLDQFLTFLKTNSLDDLNSLSSHIVSSIFADGSPSGGPCLSLANGVWVEQTLSLKPSFKQVVDIVYNAASNQVDFRTKAIEVVDEVNLWAEKQTGGLIKKLLPSDAVDNTTKLVLANAVYFKGAWKAKFDPSETKDHDFHLIDGSKVQVPFMTTMKKQFVGSFDGFKVCSLPYLQGEDKRRFSMYLFLPDEKDGIPSLLQKMGSESDFLDRHFPRRKVIGQFLVPKFKISYGFEASEMLKELGLVLPFTGGGMTGMVEASSSMGRNLCVSSIHHKAFVEVNEEGTEAAAATVGGMMLMSLITYEKVDFVADHPFLFVIREDESGVVLFIGQVVDPRDS